MPIGSSGGERRVAEEIHILPTVSDPQPHFATRACWCQPWAIQDEAGDPIYIVHHSVDGREFMTGHGAH